MSLVRPHWLMPSMLMLATVSGQRIDRHDRVVLRAEQALLLGRDHQEQDRALRLRFDGREAVRDLEQLRHAGGIVDGAVVDAVAVHGVADAQVIPVRRVDDVARCGAWDRCPRASRARCASRCVRSVFFTAIDALRLSGTGLKSRVRACFFSASKSWPAIFRIALAVSSVTHPSIADTPHVLVGRDEVEFLAQVALHDLERVTGGAFLVHDQDAGGAAPRALLELVGPAAVIRHRLAVEDLVVELRGIGGVGHLRVVHEHDDGLALDVDALEVVPVELGRGHAVAGKDHLGVADRRAVGDVLGPGDDLVLPLEGLRGPGAGDGQRPRVGRR